jgi:hypothetical protein
MHAYRTRLKPAPGMTRLYRAGSLHEARMLVDLLSHAGIEALIFNDNLIGAFGELPFAQSLPEVWLTRAGDSVAASEILAGYEQNRAARVRQHDEAELVCAACGENSPENFELCWQCGAEL